MSSTKTTESTVSTSMLAARYYGPGDIRIDRIPVPTPAAHQVLIRNEMCGICGTDLHEFTEGPIFAPTATTPDPLTGERAPVVLGHEMVGIVEAVGAEVSDIAVGARVVVEPRQTCSECEQCQNGHRNRCAKAATIGLQGGGGGLAEYVAVDAQLVFDIGSLPAEIGAIVEPLAVARHAVMRADTEISGVRAMVVGAGPIGVLITWVLKGLGAAEVVVVEPDAQRRERALAFGATQILDPGEVDEVARWQSRADLAFECAGLGVALQSCLDAVEPGGTVVNVAISGKPTQIDLLPFITKEVTLLGTICYAGDHQATIDLLQSTPFPVETFISSTIGLDDLVTEGLNELAENPGGHLKIVVRV